MFRVLLSVSNFLDKSCHCKLREKDIMAIDRRTTVLTVDDEPNMLTTLADILRDEGYDVTTAADGNTALELCSKNCYDVVLMDVRMPGLNGFEAFRRIRRHQEGVRVILMSAYDIDELKQHAIEEGAIAFLLKPLDLELIVKLISEVKDTAILVVEGEEPTASQMG